MFFAKSLVALLAAGSSALGMSDIQVIFLLRRLIVAHDSYYHHLPLPVRLLVRDFPSYLLSFLTVVAQGSEHLQCHRLDL